MGRAAEKLIRIELVDDHAMVRCGLRLLLERDCRYIVVGEAGTTDDAVAAAGREQPDLILLELDLGPDSGLECLRRLRQVAPTARVLVLTGIRNAEMHLQAIRLGAVGVLTKDQAPELLMKAIERVHAGETWLDRTTIATLLAELAHGVKPKPPDPARSQIETLTSREREVVALIAQGLRNKQIGERLHISEPTVRHHLTAVFAKLGVPDRLGLVVHAFRLGLNTLPDTGPGTMGVSAQTTPQKLSSPPR